MTEDDPFGPYSESEAVRQEVHTHLIIKSTGILPAEIKDRSFARILDIGCGGGTWIYEMSHALRLSALLVGTDADPQMITNATVKNALRHNCTFSVWDPFQTETAAPFPDDYFDLITLHFPSRWVSKHLMWLQLLNTCRLYLKKGGTLLIQDSDGLTTTSPALILFDELVNQAHHVTGRFLNGGGIHKEVVGLMSMMRHAHFPSPHISYASVDFSYSHEEENFAWRDYLRLHIHEMTPYLVGAGVTTAEELCELSMRLDGEMFQGSFCGIWTTFFLTAKA